MNFNLTQYSLIFTVLNEEDTIVSLMDSVIQQSKLPDELVIVDGGSTDNTYQVLQSYQDKLPLKLICLPGANISVGRNRAVEQSTGDIIVITDAGVELPDHWFATITQPFETSASVNAVAGFFRAAPHTLFEVALGATTLPLQREIHPHKFLPSSRSIAIKRDLFEQIDGYPEWLDHCEDIVFDLHIKQVTHFVFEPQAWVAFRPRSNIQAFFKQYYLYARGDGQANLWVKRHAIRYATYFLLVPTLLILGWTGHPLWWLGFVLGAAIYLYPCYRRLGTILKQYATQHSLTFNHVVYVVSLIPYLKLIGDIAKMIGYPIGTIQRLRHGNSHKSFT